MKKVAISLMIVFALFAQSSYAEFKEFIYGGNLMQAATFEGQAPFTLNVITFNDSQYSVGRTAEEAHTGTYSYYVDYQSSTGNLGVVTESLRKQDVMTNNDVYLECYVKGVDGTINEDWQANTVHIGCDYRDNSGIYLGQTGVRFNSEYEESTGWVRIWGILPPTDVDYSALYFGLGVNRSSDYDTSCARIYIDDISARLVPVSIAIDDAVCSGNTMPLDDLRIKAFDNKGALNYISAKGQVKYTVLSGDGYVDDEHNLVYTGAEGGNVTVKADFFTITDTFTVAFQSGKAKSLTKSTVQIADGVYTVTITNPTASDAQVSLIVAVFDSSRLRTTYNVIAAVPAYSTKMLSSEKIVVPYYVKVPDVKSYVFDITNGQKPIQ